MSTFSERFNLAFEQEKNRRRQAGEPRLLKKYLCKVSGSTSGAFAQWTSGASKMTLDRCFKVAPLLKVNPFWLFNESQKMDEPFQNSKNAIDEKSTELTPRERRLLDLFNELTEKQQEELYRLFEAKKRENDEFLKELLDRKRA
jgi:hypothetical protein